MMMTQTTFREITAQVEELLKDQMVDSLWALGLCVNDQGWYSAAAICKLFDIDDTRWQLVPAEHKAWHGTGDDRRAVVDEEGVYKLVGGIFPVAGEATAWVDELLSDVMTNYIAEHSNEPTELADVIQFSMVITSLRFVLHKNN